MRAVLGKALDKSLITVEGDILVDIFGIDNAAVAQRNSRLTSVKLGVGKRLDGRLSLLLFM